jgi:DNA ligase (NAD+)
MKELELEPMKAAEASTELIFDNVSFVITGSLEHYKNRDDLIKAIEANGGKVGSKVSSKTNYLINNDNLSNSSKNKEAKKLGTAIITEGQFVKWLNDGVKPQE